MKKTSIKNIFLSIAGRTGLILALLALNFSALGVTPAHAASLVVTKADDTNDGVCDSDCSLREAIAAAASGDTITFDGDYTIPITDLTPAKSLTIDGSGHTVTLSGGLLINAGETTVLNGLALSGHGSSGGSALGILNRGTLTLNRCTVSNYWWSIDPANLINPGAIYNTGALTINQSTLSDNGTNGLGRGGAVYNSGTLSLSQSTLIRNRASFGGGAIYNAPSGTLTIARSTLGQNQDGILGGGAIYNDGTLSLTNSTIAKNSAPDGSGLFLNGSTELLNTLIADNSPSLVSPITGVSWVSHSSGNLIETGAGSSLLAPLGNYGGLTQTYALLPGSAALNAATSTYCPGSDQRGVGYVGTCDIGAFESQGFTLAKTGGDNQSALVNTVFGAPLTVSVTANNPVEPVDGGQVAFTPPAFGASAIMTGSPATISGGAASASATAHGRGGIYTVTASARGASVVGYGFSLTNTVALSIDDVSQNEGNGGATTFTFTVSLSAPASLHGVNFALTTADGTATLADGDYTAESLPGGMIPMGGSTQTFRVTVNGDTLVEPNETFYVNVTDLYGATLLDGQGLGTILNDDFPPTPTVTTGAASGVTATGATLNGTVNANGTSTAVTFQYGLDTTYGTTFTAAQSPVSGSIASAVSYTLSGLSPNTTYHFQGVGTNAGGTVNGLDATFTTACLSAITVTNNADNGAGSLRQAIADVCAGGTIDFAGDYTILLASQLAISKALTITGVGHNVTISGNDAVRVFYIDYRYEDPRITLDNLKIVHGHADMGGGIYANGFPIVTNSTFSENSAVRGGGIYCTNMTVTNSTFSNNTAFKDHSTSTSFDGIGGGIYCNTGLRVINSTFSGNSSQWKGGGIFVTSLASTKVINSTFLVNSSYYGGSIFNDTTPPSTPASVWNTLIISSIGGGGGCAGRFSGSSVNNLTNHVSCKGIATDIDDFDYFRLAPLGNYGGPTQTYALLPGSPAIDAGDSATCAAAFDEGGAGSKDQRGVTRPAACDIGAFESQGFTLAKTGGDNQSALVNAPFAAPLAVSVTANDPLEPVDGGQITFTPPGSGASAVLTGSPATISGGAASVSATANGAAGGYNVTVSATGASSVNFALTNKGIPVIDQGTSVSVTMSEDGAPTAWTSPTITASDADGDMLTWSKLSGPSNGTVTVSGTGASPTISYAPSANFNGTDSFVVQVADVDGSDTITVNVTINAVVDTPIVTWANPANIVSGTALGGAQLNATASVPGAFVYTPPAGTILTVGTHTLHVDFTPADAVNYIPTSKDVSITVTSGSGGGCGGGLVPTITASDGTYLDKVNVTWTPVSGASYYLVYRSESLGGVKIPTSGYRAASLGGDDVWTNPGVTYYYWVRACDASGCGDFSAPDTGWQGLPAPVVTASDGTFPDKVQVTFPAVNWATSYLAYRSLSQDGVKIPTDGYFTIVPGGDDLWAAPGVTYYYWVRACNGPNCSALSAADIGWR